ncbi:MAG: N-acetyl-gamma-glutamyl-phosphate reductase [Candidatus Hydrogenedentes bacterium]|nr:N-acetyl-gamma-glutamyl-phosphate reductase [Candidatus Hydrogenedentota bacterium]
MSVYLEVDLIRVGIVGATGYGARELIRLLGLHPEVQVVAVVSESAPGKRLDEVLPAFRKSTDLVCEAFDAQALAKRCDAVFVGVPGGKSMAYGAALRGTGVRVLDLGPDFRLKDAARWQQYYKVEHQSPQLLKDAVYGLVPIHREAIRKASLVAVPGCYPITVILPLRPLLDTIASNIPVVADSISGVSGAGRSLNEAYHFPEMNENLKAYRLGVHQHIPEIEQGLDNRVMVQFTPHVAPLTRGILTTITVRIKTEVNVADRLRCYTSEPFVRVFPSGELPEVKYVRASNCCDIGWVMDQRTGNLVMVCAIDNLMGGTAGMAVQCLNLMFGLDERTGLNYGGMAP